MSFITKRRQCSLLDLSSQRLLVSVCVFFLILIYLFWAALGLLCFAWAFSSRSERGLLYIVLCRLLIVVASLVVEHKL